ncbi:gephyrin-like isoform X2 [Limulus polyphemus]|nr:gephyrin-like isoform X2 [Limulus polyphemus]XP_013776812.1 gephyrin-like isoform X2 [Limulus polyphemus]XP_022244227.1 gephyrin-like isoform X2 [Limulus polyphemus]XP_022244228.1 gephyrin-like isoform X2 [Limulus polyphemus]
MSASNNERLIQTGILTVSDRCFKGQAVDKSGHNLQAMVPNLFKAEITATQCVPDDINKIQEVLLHWCDNMKLDLVLTTGGTGCTPRDVTPEATKVILEREAPGMATAMMIESLKITPLAMISRLICGIRGKTLILNLPGSTNGSKQCMAFVKSAIPHAVDQLNADTEKIDETHRFLRHASCKTYPKKKHEEMTVTVSDKPRQSPYPLISVAEAQAVVLKEADCLQTQILDFEEALGYVLAEEITSADNIPPFPASVKDGYAVLSSDGAGIRKVVGDVPAGFWPDDLIVNSGSCIRINTGAAVPSGADAVVQVEDTELLETSEDGQKELKITILKPPTVGQDIRPPGSDVKQGTVVLSSGSNLGPAELGLLATVGTTKVSVYCKPRIAVLSTGNELVRPDEFLQPGCIRDSNKTSLKSLLQHRGFTVVDAGIAIDNHEDLVKKFKKAFEVADVVVSSGGVSMGERDILKQVLENSFGAKIHFGRVFMKPGKPTTFATLQFKSKKKLVFGLPGNPVSAIVTCNLYVLPVLRKMMGFHRPLNTTIKVKLAHPVTLDLRPEYHCATLKWELENPVPSATSTGKLISSRLLSMTSANCLLILPPRTNSLEMLDKGQQVDAVIIDWI